MNDWLDEKRRHYVVSVAFVIALLVVALSYAVVVVLVPQLHNAVVSFSLAVLFLAAVYGWIPRKEDSVTFVQRSLRAITRSKWRTIVFALATTLIVVVALWRGPFAIFSETITCAGATTISYPFFIGERAVKCDGAAEVNTWMPLASANRVQCIYTDETRASPKRQPDHTLRCESGTQLQVDHRSSGTDKDQRAALEVFALHSYDARTLTLTGFDVEVAPSYLAAPAAAAKVIPIHATWEIRLPKSGGSFRFNAPDPIEIEPNAIARVAVKFIDEDDGSLGGNYDVVVTFRTKQGLMARDSVLVVAPGEPGLIRPGGKKR